MMIGILLCEVRKHGLWIMIGGLVTLAFVACQPDAASPISADSPASIDLAASGEARVYSFRADSRLPTVLKFEAESSNTPFTAEVRDNKGNVIAQLGSSTLQNATLTIGPDNGLYDVVVTSAGTEAGRVSLSMSTVTQPTVLPRTGVSAKTTNQTTSALPVAYRQSAALTNVCSIAATNSPGVNIYNGPDMGYTAIASLPTGKSVIADSRTDSGWYHITLDGIDGWVSDRVVTLNGLCSGLPLQTSSAGAQTMSASLSGNGVSVPGVVAPYDPDSYYFGIDRNAGGDLSDAISYPNGDSIDRILMAVNNPPTTGLFSRTFTFTLYCKGTGTEFLRWGMAQSPTLLCGDSIALPFSSNYDQQSFVVTLPGATGQSYVDYLLRAEPTAPADANPFALVIDRDTGGQFGEVISYPNGDHSDQIQLSVANLGDEPANRYREYHVTLLCDGMGTDAVRWGAIDNPALTCGATVIVPFSLGMTQQNLLITVPDGSPESYVDYKLRVLPAAPYDAETYVFGIDRDGGGQFNELISYPAGDTRDTVQVTVTTLTEHAPYNYREFNLTLYCSGIGVEHVRWGAPDNPTLLCGNTIKLPFMFNTDQSLAVNVPDGGGQTYVTYTLVAAPVPGS
jgi:uncharacterized protein YraI